MAHPVIARVDEEALHPPDLPIDGMDTVTGAELYLAPRDNVLNDRSPVYRLGAYAGAEEIARAGWCVFLNAGGAHKVPFLSAIELVELRARTAQPDFPGRSLDQVDRNKPKFAKKIGVATKAGASCKSFCKCVANSALTE